MFEVKSLLRITIGDFWDYDTDEDLGEFEFCCNVPVDEVKRMYFVAVEKSGVNFNEEFCSEEDEFISKKDLKRLPKEILEKCEIDPKKDWYPKEPQPFFELFMAWLCYYNPELEWKYKYDVIENLTGYDSDRKYNVPMLGNALVSDEEDTRPIGERYQCGPDW